MAQIQAVAARVACTLSYMAADRRSPSIQAPPSLAQHRRTTALRRPRQLGGFGGSAAEQTPHMGTAYTPVETPREESARVGRHRGVVPPTRHLSVTVWVRVQQHGKGSGECNTMEIEPDRAQSQWEGHPQQEIRWTLLLQPRGTVIPLREAENNQPPPPPHRPQGAGALPLL